MQDQNQSNPYSAPSATVSDLDVSEGVLAGRLARLGAAIIDVIIFLVPMLPLMFFFGYFSAITSGVEPGFFVTTMWSVTSIIVMAAIQYLPLSQSGQTWGKKALSIKIVDANGHKPDIVTLLLKRYFLIQWAPGLIPFLGALFSLVNILFIFRADRRCIHDLVADTRVVNV